MTGTALSFDDNEGTGVRLLRVLFDKNLPLNLPTDSLADDQGGPELTDSIDKVNLIPSNVLVPVTKSNIGRFKPLHKWIGVVNRITEDSFESTVQDRINPENPDEVVTLAIEEIPPDDLSLLCEGAVFYWAIGYADDPGKPRTRESQVRFRRISNWSQEELDRSREEGQRLASRFTTD